MKITLIVFLSLVTLVICGDNPPKDKCVCTERQCTDTSCEDKHCLCIIKAIKNLLAQPHLNYPKKWLEFYLKIIQERCLCIRRCQTICSPKELIECTTHAFEVFYCKFHKWLAGISGDKGYKDFIKDIQHILRTCLNKDCKPICSGDDGCKAFNIKPKDCGCTKRCVVKFLQDFAKSLENEFAKDSISNLALYASAFYDQRMNCEHIKNENQRELCIETAEREINRIRDAIKDELITELGVCRAIGIMSAVDQGIGGCAFEKK
ncbi:uncharacterized protein LOC129569823 [Sitodiplosis mosellana]|uniref:uncharacterized protein LOC129569823 n=1 Tax=Sitodiplosis mosellana TaxID=263140 RepID=UPI00244484C0|nr:uncharacterized protein LOC129569823 [Sitodiplosis mosellana]